MKLNKYKGLKAVKENVAVTEEQVMQQLEAIRQQNQKTLNITDRAAQMGDEVILDYAGFAGEEQFEGGTAQKQSLTLGSGMFIPGFEEQLVGASIGEQVDVKVTFPEQYHAPALAGKEAVFHCTIHEIHGKELYPMDDTFAQTVAGLQTLEEMKAVLKEQMVNYYANMGEQQLQDQLVAAVIEECEEMEISEEEMAQAIEFELQSVNQQMMQQGMTLEMYLKFSGKTMDDVRADLRPQVTKSIHARMALEEVARLENIVVSDEEVNAELELMAREYGIGVEQLKTLVGESADTSLRKDIMMKKAIRVLVDNAEIEEQ